MTEDFLLNIKDGELYVVIPLHVAEELDINEGDNLSLGIEKDRMYLTKVEEHKK